MDGSPVSSKVFPTLGVAINSPRNDWLVQKIPEKKDPKPLGKNLPDQAVENKTMPVHIKLQSVDEDVINDRSLVSALSEASWDFPAGTWSSRNLSCVSLAKKANRHGMRIVQFVNGEPVLPVIHPSLKDSLFFI